MTREERYIEFDGRIDRYLRNQMDESERAAFERDVDNNQELRERLVATAMLAKGIAHAGMQREGQAQLDAIRQMSRDEFNRASQVKQNKRLVWSFMKWASGIAAIAVIAYGLYTFIPFAHVQNAEQAELAEETPKEQKATPKPAKPTLASLADEYNKPFSSEPDEFVSIRKQIKKGRSKDMMAVVSDIENLEWPTAKHGPKGADDEDDIKNTTDNFNDCTHWYKALAYLKANDIGSAIRELNELIDYGKNAYLVECANDLLKKLKKLYLRPPYCSPY